MKYPKIRELVEAVKALVAGPCTTGYPYKVHTPPKRFRGKPEYSNEGCIGCAACVLVCPARAIESRDVVTDNKATRKMILHLDECHYCGQCSALCTTAYDTPPGIRHTAEFDLAGFDRRDLVSITDEKELSLCEICGDIITTKAHLDWIARKIGPLAFSNPALFIPSLSKLGLSESVFQRAVDVLTRPDRIKVLCAKCRRHAVIERF